MTTPAIITLVKMLEPLPVTQQEQAVEHLREYLAELADEARWQGNYERTAARLTEAARQARKDIDEGKAKPMDFDRL